jgi:hypothetical protein
LRIALALALGLGLLLGFGAGALAELFDHSVKNADDEPARFSWSQAACPTTLRVAGAERQRAPPLAFAS